MGNRIAAPVGAKSLLGIGLQVDDETPATAQDLLKYRQGGLDGSTAMLYSQANLDTPAERTGDPVKGNFTGTGDFVLELSPRRATSRLFTAVLGNPTEVVLSPATPALPTASGGIASLGDPRWFYFVVARTSKYPSLPSAPSLAYLQVPQTVTFTVVAGATSYDILRGTTNVASAALKVGTVTTGTTFADSGADGTAYSVIPVVVSDKAWKHTWETRMVTMSQLKGQAVFAFPMTKVHGFSIRVDRTDGSLITANFKAKPGNMGVICGPKANNGQKATALATVGLDTALYDTALPFSPAISIVKIADIGGTLIASTTAKGFDLDFDRKSADEYTLNGKLGPYAFTDGVTGLTQNLNAYFKGEAQEHLARFMGHASDIGAGTSFGFKADIKLVSVTTSMPYPSGYGFNNELSFVTPRCAYSAVGQPVGGRGDTIMQSLRVDPIFDGSGSTDIEVHIVSCESAASIIAASGGTFAMPDNDVQ